LYLLSLMETVAMRLRDKCMMARVLAVSLRDTQLSFYSHQRRLLTPSDNTDYLYDEAKRLFTEMWQGNPLRHFGVHLSELTGNEFYQTSLFDNDFIFRRQSLDRSIDIIRLSHGSDAIIRGAFLHSGIPPLCGGVHESFPNMRSLL